MYSMFAWEMVNVIESKWNKKKLNKKKHWNEPSITVISHWCVIMNCSHSAGADAYVFIFEPARKSSLYKYICITSVTVIMRSLEQDQSDSYGEKHVVLPFKAAL